MKNFRLTLVFVVCSIRIAAFAQEIPTPDYSARPYCLKSDNTLQNLERADAAMDTKLKGLGYGGVEMYYSAFGVNSAVRFNQNSLPRIIIKLDANVDPEESITLSKAEVKKDRRRFLQGSMSMTGAARNTSGAEVKLQFKKIRDGIFEIILPTSIGLGEYAFMPMGDQSISLTSVSNIKISCFGIDESSGSNFSNQTNTAITSSTNTPSNTPASVPNNTTDYPMPDFDNVIYYLNPPDHSLVDLERAINSKSESTLGFLNFKNAVSIKGLASPVVITADKDNSFILRLANGTDPYTLIELMPCVANESKQTRDYNPKEKKDQPAVTTITLKFKRVGNNTYLITSLQPITKGEYFFANKALKEKSIFAFQVK